MNHKIVTVIPIYKAELSEIGKNALEQATNAYQKKRMFL